MSNFLKYVHLERFGTSEVEGIEIGTTYVFPKLDGTNGQVWLSEDGHIMAGSRNRVLSSEADNAGFYSSVEKDDRLKRYLQYYPHHTLYGEWLVPHSLKTYREDAWRKFYIFDVLDQTTGAFIHYENYRQNLLDYGLDFLSPLALIKNGSLDNYLKCLDKNTYLIKDGEGVGEGIVIKNYSWQNKYGRVTWAKLVTNAFKEVHSSTMGAPEIGGKILEETILDEFLTEHLIRKTKAKIEVENNGWQSKFIPQLLARVWNDLITEEIWEILKRHKNPKIDFSTLNRLAIQKVKTILPEVF